MTKSKDLIKEMADVTELKMPCDSGSHYLRNKSAYSLACSIEECYQKGQDLKRIDSNY